MRLSFDCKRCGKEFLRPMSFKGDKGFCSRRCANARTAQEVALIRAKVARIGKCEQCGKMGRLHGHHIIPRSERPDLAERDENIEVLCCGCHAARHPEMKLLKRWRSG